MKKSVAVWALALGGMLSACGELPEEGAGTDVPGATDDDEVIIVGGGGAGGTNGVGPDSKAQVWSAGNYVDGYHFVQVSTKGAPLWSAWVDQVDSKTHRLINHQATRKKSGGKVTFWFWGYPGTSFRVHLDDNGVSSREWWMHETRLDYCFRVKEFGQLQYTGDSLQGCNEH